jgi:hypothetical protein
MVGCAILCIAESVEPHRSIAASVAAILHPFAHRTDGPRRSRNCQGMGLDVCH